MLSRKAESFTESVIREMTRLAQLHQAVDPQFTHYLIREIGVAAVPGSSFFHDPEAGSRYVRFCFCKREATLQAAMERLQKIHRQNHAKIG